MKNNFKLLTCSGIGDIIYTWYKMQYYYKLGYSFDIYIPDFFPKRGKQLDGMIDGINSINYISINNFDKYKFLDPGSLFEPNSENILDDIVILNINSFIDNGINLNNFIVEAMPDYNFHLNINENYSNLSKEFINFEVNIFLYTSSLSTNLRWKSRPDSLFWFNLVQYAKNHFFKDKQICIHLCGAEYDFELMSLVAKELKFNFIKFYQYVNEDFHFICSILKNCNLSIVHESGFIMLADLFKIPCISIYSKKIERNNKKAPYTGIVNPETYENFRMINIMHDDNFIDIKDKLNYLKVIS